MERGLHCVGSPKFAEHGVDCRCREDKGFAILQQPTLDYPSPQRPLAGIVHLPVPPVQEVRNMDWFVHDSGARNILNALNTRVDVCRPTPTNEGVADTQMWMDRVSDTIGYTRKASMEEVVAGMKTRKKRLRYQRAMENIRKGRLGSKFGKISCFVKKEAKAYETSKPEPDCRAIQFRSPETTLVLMTVIKPREHKLYHVAGGHFPPTRCMTKGMTPTQIASHILDVKKLQRFKFHVGLDASRFDASCHPRIIQVEHSLWSKGHERDSLFMRGLKSQMSNSGGARTPDGNIAYKITGTRMSGDANTAAGNNAIMFCMLNSFGCWLSGDWDSTGVNAGKAYDFILDGDDSVFSTDIDFTEEDVDRFFSVRGFKMKFEFKTEDVSQILFCQRRLVHTVTGWNMVRDPLKVISKFGVNPLFKDLTGRPKLVQTIAQGELSQSMGVPILQALCLCYKRIGEKYTTGPQYLKNTDNIAEFEWRFGADWKDSREKPITQEARLTFWRAFGISPQRQKDIELILASWDFNLLDQGVRGSDISANWTYDWLHPEKQF